MNRRLSISAAPLSHKSREDWSKTNENGHDDIGRAFVQDKITVLVY